MEIRGKKTAFLVVSFLLLLAGCTVVGKPQEESKAVDLGRAKLVSTRIKMDTGKLEIAGGTDQLLEADFSYNVASWKPRIDYEISGIRGELTVEQPPGAKGAPLGKVLYRWELRLNEDVPMDLAINLGVGRSDFRLGDLLLERLNIKAGAGNMDLDLTGKPSLISLNLDIGAGDVEVDLRGDWKDNLDASIKGGVGDVKLRLPGDVGVRVDARRGIGDIHVKGLSKKAGAYVNRAYGRSGVTLHIDIKAGVGEISLEQEQN